MVACPGENRTREISTEPNRSGEPLESVSSRYADNRPSISADGTKIVFSSGRDGNDQIRTSKAYKADWPVGVAPGTPSRVTAVDLGIEHEAVISPDGRWVALLTTKGGKTDLYLQEFADSAKPAMRASKPDTGVTLSQPSFSPDGKLIAWIARTSGTAAVAMLAEIGEPTEDALQDAAFQVTGSDEVVQQLTWAETGNAVYALITGAASPGGKLAYSQRTFASVQEAKTAAKTSWLTPFSVAKGQAPAVAANKALIAQGPQGLETAMSVEVGDGVPSTPNRVQVRSRPLLYVAADKDPVPFEAALGYDVTAMRLANDGATAFMLEKSYYQCKGDSVDAFGASILVLGTDTKAVPARLNLRLKDEGETSPTSYNYEVVDDICKRQRSESSFSRIDDKVADLVVATKQATATAFRAIFVTRFTPHFYGNCTLKAGDSELFALEVSDAAKNVYPLAPNPAPLVDDSPGSCALKLPVPKSS